MSAPSYADLLALATEVAVEAGRLAERMREEGLGAPDTKSSPTDVVTAADRAAERLIRERVLGVRPDDGFLGEEGDDVPSRSGVRWIVDPIDGTVNYLYGKLDYAVSVAAEHDGVTVAGIVHQPSVGRSYTAVRGGGAHRDGVPIRVRDVVPMDQRLVHTGFSYVRDTRAAQAAYVAALLPQVRDVRRPGSAALDICAVASAQADGYVEEGAHLWDYAAAALVAEEAGGRLEVHTTSRGNELVVCAPAGGFDDLFTLLQACGFLGNT